MYHQYNFDCHEQDFIEFREVSLDSLFIKKFGKIGD